jgi:hypothetical protein
LVKAVDGVLDRSEVRMIPLDVYFSFKFHFKLEFFQNVNFPGTFLHSSFALAVLGFAQREIKCAEQVQSQQLINTHVVLCVNGIPLEQKTGFLRGFAYF